MPWHLSADLKYFKKITLGKPIMMGRKTCESIGRPLPGRRNIVISRDPDFNQKGFDVFNTPDAALADCQQQAEVMVIGGAQLYQALLPQADYLYITYIHARFPGDTFFPDFEQKQWQEIKRFDVEDDEQVSFKYSFVALQRR
jgi:dihydrofolate reductase